MWGKFYRLVASVKIQIRNRFYPQMSFSWLFLWTARGGVIVTVLFLHNKSKKYHPIKTFVNVLQMYNFTVKFWIWDFFKTFFLEYFFYLCGMIFYDSIILVTLIREINISFNYDSTILVTLIREINISLRSYLPWIKRDKS